MNQPADGGGSDTLRPGTILGRYEIRRLLGQGGMGCVYEAVHTDLKKRVAIKTLLPALASNSDARQRFLREGEAASRIRHPHVVDVTDLGSEGSVIYLVMEYLEGEDLSRLLARQGFLSASEAADIMLPVAAAIATAHEKGVIHRDLKPENIFLARTAYGAVQPKVLDFGISKVLGDSRARALTGTAATMGTMHYLPPEQLRHAREADARSDQYGLGTILYECVTGRRAFEEESFYILLKKIAEGEYLRPSLQRPGVSDRIEAIIMRAMSLEPLDRFASVKELGAALLELASETTRVLWAPFFGAPPVMEAYTPAHTAPMSTLAVPANPASASASFAAPARPKSGSESTRLATDRPRVATLIEPKSEPKSPSSETMELPELPATTRKPSSTTLRSATGERPLPRRGSGRWRAPAAVAGVALVAAVAALVALRGKGDDRRVEPEQTSFETAPATRPVSASPGEEKLAPPIPARASDPEPGAAPRPVTATATATATATSPKPSHEKPAAGADPKDIPAIDKAADGTARHKKKGPRKAGAGKGARTNPASLPTDSTDSTDSPSVTPSKTANDAPVIQP